MLRGTKVGLRARFEEDVPVLHEELYNDIPTRSRTDSRPWRPVAPGAPDSPFTVSGPDERFVPFSVVMLDSGELAGSALLWGIDNHNRTAHLGMALRPSFRGKGLGADLVRVLCEYGFSVRGMNRLQLETLSDNEGMRGAAASAGFTHEGTLRGAAWVCGSFLDEVVYGLLVTDWAKGRETGPGATA